MKTEQEHNDEQCTMNSELKIITAHARRLQQCVELLHDKYSVTLADLLSERDEATKVLDGYLKELGYI